MRKKSKRIRQLSILVFVLAASIILGIIIFSPKPSKEVLVTSNVVQLTPGQNMSAVFNASSAITQSMTSGCKILAVLRIYANQVEKQGNIEIYINELYIGQATISSTGEVAIASACGCSTSCVCEINAGENVIKIVSEGFQGEIKYEVYAKL